MNMKYRNIPLREENEERRYSAFISPRIEEAEWPYMVLK